MTRRVIAHIDADAFYASVHEREDPSLQGKPLIVGGRGARSIVTTASYAARAFGVHSAMPMTRALRQCPHAIVLVPDFTLYRRYSAATMTLVRELTTVVEPLSLDEAYLDLTHVDDPIRKLRELIARIERDVGLTYSVGVGPNKLCAKVLSDLDKPQAFNKASREQCCEIFAKASPRRIPGIGPKTAEQLQSLGYDTIENVREATLDELVGVFGERRARELQARCRFEHDGDVVVSGVRKSLSDETTFDTDIDDVNEIEERLRRQAADVARQLHAKGMRGRTIGIKVRLADFTTITRARTIDDDVDDAETIGSIAAELLRANPPSQPVRLIGVRVANFEHERVGKPQQLRFRFV